MTNQKLLEWTRIQILQKRDPKELRELLLNKGYNLDDVNEAIMSATLEPSTKEENHSNRPVFLVILAILAIAIVGSSILVLSNKNSESVLTYSDYMNKHQSLQAYALAYEVKLPIMTVLSEGDADKMLLQVYKERDKEKRIATFNTSGKIGTFYYYTIDGKKTNCWKNSIGEVSCNNNTVSKETSRPITIIIPDDISELLNQSNFIFKSKHRINGMECLLFSTNIEDMDKFMDATHSLTQGLSVPEKKGMFDICVHEETGTIVSLKMNSKLKLSAENTILEYTLLSFSNNVSYNEFSIPSNIK